MGNEVVSVDGRFMSIRTWIVTSGFSSSSGYPSDMAGGDGHPEVAWEGAGSRWGRHGERRTCC